MNVQMLIGKSKSPELAIIHARLLGEYLTRDYLNFEAIYSDETENFVECGNGAALFRLRVLKGNVETAFLHENENVHALEKVDSDEMFDYLGVKLPISVALSYYYSIEKSGRRYFYNKQGLHQGVDTAFHFKFFPDFEVPEWAVGAVMYQIYVDRFYNGDKSNDVATNEYTYLGRVSKKIEDWNALPLADDICNFYGGDLQGVMAKMEYLKSLGVDAIYFNPIFVSPSNHKYDAQDYDYVDPHIAVIMNDEGKPLSVDKLHNRYASMYIERTTDKENLEASNALFCKLIEIAHANGIRVILDGVFNHCGAFNKWLDKEGFYYAAGYEPGAYRDEKSPYHNYFYWFDSNWPNNDCYSSWWNHDNHPKLNFEGSDELYQYILDVGRKWVSPPFNADGWRLDVAADLGCSQEFNHKFWRDFRRVVKEANPNAIIIAEHYGDPQPWLMGDQWDTVMNYDAFMEPITWFLTGMEKHSEEFNPGMLNNTMAFEGAMRYYMACMGVGSLHTAMNQLSNHDHSRFLTRTNMTAGRLHTVGSEAADQGVRIAVLMEAVVFQMTWPGSPTIYYGDEAGLAGWTDPDNRRTYPWGRENRVVLDFHRKIISLRKRLPVLKRGSLEFLHNEHGILSYGRFDKSERVAVIINNNSSIRKLTIPLWKIGVAKNSRMELLILTENDDFSTESMYYHVVDGFMQIGMMPHSSVILREVGK